ncbi:MAG TPA: TIGR00725 family protein [Anaerolineae bacterium]|nr:TIGR00725 family protein [Anaerolineae bacterium]
MNRAHAEKLLVGIIGMDDHGDEEPVSPFAIQAAEEVGRLIAQRGGILLSGGRRGIMEAASRGANLAGGIVVAFLPGSSKSEANPYVTVPLATGLGDIRNHLTIRASDVVIMISGSTGTLNEATITYWQKPLVVLEGTGGWSDRLREIAYKGRHLDERGSAEIVFVTTPEEAVNKAIELAQSKNQEIISAAT